MKIKIVKNSIQLDINIIFVCTCRIYIALPFCKFVKLSQISYKEIKL